MITQNDLNKAWGLFSIQERSRNMRGQITSLEFTIRGVKGGKGHDSNQEIFYKCFADVSSIDSSLPEVWILSPLESSIKHINIFRPGNCPLKGTNLPHICWGQNSGNWQKNTTPRTLLNLIHTTKGALSLQNFNSPAR